MSYTRITDPLNVEWSTSRPFKRPKELKPSGHPKDEDLDLVKAWLDGGEVAPHLQAMAKDDLVLAMQIACHYISFDLNEQLDERLHECHNNRAYNILQIVPGEEALRQGPKLPYLEMGLHFLREQDAAALANMLPHAKSEIGWLRRQIRLLEGWMEVTKHIKQRDSYPMPQRFEVENRVVDESLPAISVIVDDREARQF